MILLGARFCHNTLTCFSFGCDQFAQVSPKRGGPIFVFRHAAFFSWNSVFGIHGENVFFRLRDLHRRKRIRSRSKNTVSKMIVKKASCFGTACSDYCCRQTRKARFICRRYDVFNRQRNVGTVSLRENEHAYRSFSLRSQFDWRLRCEG